MNPIHKYNNGLGATLCHRCNKVILEGHTEDLFCSDKCETIFYDGKKGYREKQEEINNTCEGFI